MSDQVVVLTVDALDRPLRCLPAAAFSAAEDDAPDLPLPCTAGTASVYLILVTMVLLVLSNLVRSKVIAGG